MGARGGRSSAQLSFVGCDGRSRDDRPRPRLAQPARRVLAITGDGEQLTGLGSLATIAVQRPTNLAIVVFDNERYGETGMQPTLAV